MKRNAHNDHLTEEGTSCSDPVANSVDDRGERHISGPGPVNESSPQSRRILNEALDRPPALFDQIQRDLAVISRPPALFDQIQRDLAVISRPPALFDQIQRDLAAISRPPALFDQIQRDLAAISRPPALFDQIQRDLAVISRPPALFDQIQRDLAAISRPPALFDQIQRDLAAISRPPALFDQIQRDLAAISRPPALFDQIQRDLAAISRPPALFDQIQRDLAVISRPPALFDQITRQLRWEDPFAAPRKKGERLTQHGWFPHYTIPEELLDEGIEGADFNHLLLSYYRDNWAHVRQTIEGNLAAYPVNGETKAAFLEALESHEHGLYRSVCRNLMAEVEHVVRIHLYGGKVGSFSVKKQIGDDFGILPVSILPDRQLGFVGYFYLQDHLYGHINNEVDRNRFVNHQVPNRHATVHGLLTYPTEQNSLNSIFLVEYVLQLLSARNVINRGALQPIGTG